MSVYVRGEQCANGEITVPVNEPRGGASITGLLSSMALEKPVKGILAALRLNFSGRKYEIKKQCWLRVGGPLSLHKVVSM